MSSRNTFGLIILLIFSCGGSLFIGATQSERIIERLELLSNTTIYVSYREKYEQEILDLEKKIDGFSSEVTLLQKENDELEAEKSGLEIRVISLERDHSKLGERINSLQNDLSSFSSQISTLRSQKSSLESQVSTLRSQKSSLESQLSAYKQEENKLQNSYNQLNTQYTNLLNEKNNLQNTYNNLNNKHNTLIDRANQKYIKIHFNWTYNGVDWWIWKQMPLSLYINYCMEERQSFVNMCHDNYDDWQINWFANMFNSLANNNGLSEYEKVMLVVTFVQKLPYSTDEFGQYANYPIETLVEWGGDCEDTSILLASILYSMNYDVALIRLPDHVAVGIAGLEGSYGRYYSVDSKQYFYIESTGEGWDIGEMPIKYQGTSASIYVLNKYD